jgi:hypothetical protein
MDIVVSIVSWVAWALLTVLGLAWRIVWFLISGWVSTLLQIAVLIATIFFLKYGWQRAPLELWKRTRSVALFAWGWVRTREPQGGASTRELVRETVRIVRVKEVGDVNISTLLSLLMVGGLALIAALA